MSEAARSIGAEAPVVTARSPALTPDMSVAAAFRAVLAECGDHIAGNVAAVLEQRDAEGLHQLRIGLRRLNIAMACFAPEFGALRERAKAFFDATANARDLDVFLVEAFEPVVAALDPQEGFAVLRARAEQMRARAWDAAVRQVSDGAFSDLLSEVGAAATRGLPEQALTQAVLQAPVVLNRALARVTKRGRGFKSLGVEGTHRLRIALKKLRYAAEFHAKLYGDRPARRYLKRLKTLQDLLGAQNDAAQVRILLGHLMMVETASAPLQADLSFAAGLITGWHQASARHLKTEASARWREFKKAKPFWAA